MQASSLNMTIKGLGNLAENQAEAWETISFAPGAAGPTHFVADGSALEWSIYGKIDWKCGGQMKEFAGAIRAFVDMCHKYVSSDRLYRTLYARETDDSGMVVNLLLLYAC